MRGDERAGRDVEGAVLDQVQKLLAAPELVARTWAAAKRGASPRWRCRVRYVPYDQGNAAVELLGRRIDAALRWPSVFKSHAEAGDLRMLVVTSETPVPSVPDVPTAKDQGHDVNLVLWRGVAAPEGTPAEAIAKLEAAVEAVVASEQFQEASARIGCDREQRLVERRIPSE